MSIDSAEKEISYDYQNIIDTPNIDSECINFYIPKDFQTYTPKEKLQIFRISLDRIVLCTRAVVKKITPLLLKIVSIIGVIVLLQNIGNLINPFNIWSLYQKEVGDISKTDLETRFYTGIGLYAFFFLMILILCSYILSKISECGTSVRPHLKVLSQNISQLVTVSRSLYKDIYDAGSLALNIASSDRFRRDYQKLRNRYQ